MSELPTGVTRHTFDGTDRLATRGEPVYGEPTDGAWRAWNPNRSKLGAMLETGMDTGLDGGDHYIDSEQTAHPEVTGWRAESKTFLDAVLAGQPPVQNSVEEGVQVQRVLDAIYESSERGDEHALRVSPE